MSLPYPSGTISPDNSNRKNIGSFTLHAFVVVALMVTFAGQIFLTSIDVAFHYVLIHEIEKFGFVRPDVASLPLMTIYPRVSHWLAAVVGWIGGSDIVAMMLIITASIYITYVLVDQLLHGISGVAPSIAFAVIFFALSLTRAQVGWEIVGNFFYPQIVGNVLVFGTLCWLASDRDRSSWHLAFFLLAIVIAATSVQPISAVHILGAGLIYLTFLAFRKWLMRQLDIEAIFALIIVIIAGAIVLKFHPTMSAMRLISNNNGALDFGFSDNWVGVLLPIAGLIGCTNLLVCFYGRGVRIDAVVASALIAIVGIAVVQYAILRLVGEGSIYAVKKHIFMVVTLSAISLARLISNISVLRWVPNYSQRGPALAGLATLWILYGQGQPSWPIRDIMAQATDAANLTFLNFKPGNTVVGDTYTAISPIAQILISSSAFEYPMTEKTFSWLTGRRAEQDAEYVMLQRKPDIIKSCSERFWKAALTRLLSLIV